MTARNEFLDIFEKNFESGPSEGESLPAWACGLFEAVAMNLNKDHKRTAIEDMLEDQRVRAAFTQKTESCLRAVLGAIKETSCRDTMPMIKKALDVPEIKKAIALNPVKFASAVNDFAKDKEGRFSEKRDLQKKVFKFAFNTVSKLEDDPALDVSNKHHIPLLVAVLATTLRNDETLSDMGRSQLFNEMAGVHGWKYEAISKDDPVFAMGGKFKVVSENEGQKIEVIYQPNDEDKVRRKDYHVLLDGKVWSAPIVPINENQAQFAPQAVPALSR